MIARGDDHQNAAVGQGDIEDVAQRVRRSVLKLLQPAGDAP